MTWIFAFLVLAGLAAMAWSFLAAARLEASVIELEKRLSGKENPDGKDEEVRHA